MKPHVRLYNEVKKNQPLDLSVDYKKTTLLIDKAKDRGKIDI
jgi:hypothetical protein